MATTTWFSTKLSAALEQRGLSTRAAAKLWRPEKPESARRSLIRYLQGDVLPEPHTVAELADAIGVDREALTADEEEESDPMVVLMHAVRLLVRQAIADERGELCLG